jgi:hypothetical protein
MQEVMTTALVSWRHITRGREQGSQGEVRRNQSIFWVFYVLVQFLGSPVEESQGTSLIHGKFKVYHRQFRGWTTIED